MSSLLISPLDIAPPERIAARKNYKKDIPAPILAQLAMLEGKDNWHNLFFTGYDWFIIAVSISITLLTHMNPFVYVVAVLMIGSRQRALMNLLHEASHKKLFRNHALNDWVGRLLTAYPMGASFTAYQSNHFIHHGFLWDPEKDPKIQRYRTLGLITPPSHAFTFFRQQILWPLLLGPVLFNIKSALSLKDERADESPIRYGFLGVIILIVVVTHQFMGFLLFWLIPFCTSFQIIRYWNEMAQHAGLPDYNAWMATRNWNSSAFIEWFIGSHSDDLYHLAHHLFPLIPHYRLSQAHRLLMQVPQYANAHHCDGFFFPRRATAPSVLQDIRRPRDLQNYHHLAQHQRSHSVGHEGKS